VSTPPDRDGSSERRYVTVVVRLLVDGRGRLLHGEYVDVEGQVQGRFAQWRDFNRAMKGLLGQR
jgi:hypothetical protein